MGLRCIRHHSSDSCFWVWKARISPRGVVSGEDKERPATEIEARTDLTNAYIARTALHPRTTRHRITPPCCPRTPSNRTAQAATRAPARPRAPQPREEHSPPRASPAVPPCAARRRQTSLGSIAGGVRLRQPPASGAFVLGVIHSRSPSRMRRLLCRLAIPSSSAICGPGLCCQNPLRGFCPVPVQSV